MSQSLYAEFSTAFMALPEGDMLGALDVAESFVNGAHHNCRMDTVLSLVEIGRPADRLLQVFEGRTVREAVAVMSRLRGEMADELARRGAPADVVREVRENVPRPGEHGETV
jgi:microcompartment protein CcmL/EutN